MGKRGLACTARHKYCPGTHNCSSQDEPVCCCMGKGVRGGGGVPGELERMPPAARPPPPSCHHPCPRRPLRAKQAEQQGHPQSLSVRFKLTALCLFAPVAYHNPPTHAAKPRYHDEVVCLPPASSSAAAFRDSSLRLRAVSPPRRLPHHTPLSVSHMYPWIATVIQG